MDPISVSSGVAGFLSLAMEILRILTAYIGNVKPVSDDAHNLLKEILALCHILEQLVALLRNDVKGQFAPTSSISVVIIACQAQMEQLYKKVEKLRIRSDKNLVGMVHRTLEWPFRKDGFDSTLATLHRFAKTFQFSLTVSNSWVFSFGGSNQQLNVNSELLSKSSSEVLSKIEEKQSQLQETIEGLKQCKCRLKTL